MYRHTAIEAKMSECEQINHSIVMQRYWSAICAIAFFPRFAKYGYASNIPQKPAMPIHRSINQTQSYANVAQRLLQFGCIMATSY